MLEARAFAARRAAGQIGLRPWEGAQPGARFTENQTWANLGIPGKLVNHSRGISVLKSAIYSATLLIDRISGYHWDGRRANL